MFKRWLRSRWLWLAACVLTGSLVVTIPALTLVRQAMQIADAVSGGVRDGLREGLKDAGSRRPPKETRRMSVSFLFGLVQIEDTRYPYLWTAVGGVVTGGGAGFGVWLVALGGLWACRRVRGAPPRSGSSAGPGPHAERSPGA